jgi:HPt (histidine-containing phosphotransfer) domain-containing protein
MGLKSILASCQSTGTAEYLRQDTQGRLNTVRSLLEQGERERARQIVHSLKGSSGAVGAGEVHRLATELDTLLRGNAPLADAFDLFSQLETTQKDLVVALQSLP